MSDSSDEDVGELQDQQEYSEDEVLPSDYSDSDDDSLEEDPRFKRFQIELKKDEMASDIESENEEDYLPDSQAWGSNKQLFYNTDYVDKDFRSKWFFFLKLKLKILSCRSEIERRRSCQV